MEHFASSHFWKCYDELPFKIKILADKNFELLKENPYHSSLSFKKVGQYWSARVGLKYRALAIESPEDNALIWFWIGSHADYDELIK